MGPLAPIITTGAKWMSKAPIVGGLLDIFGGERANRINQREAQKNREFQERMSSTAVRRAVADYTAAGLNPALAYERSASSPGGAQATVQNAIKSGISTAREVAQYNESMKLMRAQAYAAAEQGGTNAKMREKIDAEIRQLDATTAGINADNTGREAEAGMWRALGNVGGPLGKALRTFAPILQLLFARKGGGITINR